MKDIRKVVYQELIKVCQRVYYEEVVHATQLPYIVFSFPSDGRVYQLQEESDLQIDIYDVDRDGYNVSVEIDEAVRKVIRLLDYKSFQEGDTSFWFKRKTRQAIPFPADVNIWARQLVFETKIYRSSI